MAEAGGLAGDPPRSSTATILFSELVGSTAWRARLGEERADELRRVHDDLLTIRIEANGGEVLKGQGDGLVAAFPSASDALGAAVEMQQAVAAQNRRSSAVVETSIRIGLSVGDVAWDGRDCFGTPLVEAARLEAAAEDGQILCTEFVRMMARGRGGHAFNDLGFLELKGLPEPVATCEALWSPTPEPVSAAVPLPLDLAVARGRLVSRRPEIRVADRLLTDPARERAAVLWLLGEPGIGKTRLATELARRAHAGGTVILFGRCSEDLSVPYQPFVEALRTFVEQVPASELPTRLGDAPGELIRLLPDLDRRLPGLAAPRPAGPELEQHRLFAAVRSWLASAGGDRPVLAVFDDVHWAARPTLQMLAHAARSAAPSRALLVCTARNTSPDDNEDLARLAEELERQGASSQRLELSGLGLEAVGELVEHSAGRRLDDGLRSLAVRVHAETAGNPLFIGALLSGVEDVVAERPRTVSETVRRLVGRLPGPVADLLRTAAVVGLDFDLRVLAGAAGRDELDVLDALEMATGAGLAEESGPDRYRFVHALVRAALRDELSQSRRVRLHLRIAESLEAIHAGGLDEYADTLAYHFTEAVPAGGAERAFHHTVAAARRADRLVAHADAAAAYGRAIELLPAVAGASPLSRGELLLAQADAYNRAADYSAARRVALAAFEEAAARGATDQILAAALAFESASFKAAGRLSDIEVFQAIELLQQAEAAIPPADSSERALVMATLGRGMVFSGRRSKGVEWGQVAVAMARRLNDPAILAEVLTRTAWPDAVIERAELLPSRVREILTLAADLGDEELRGWASLLGAWSTLQLGQLRAHDEFMTDVERVAERIKQPLWSDWLRLIRHLRALVAGKLDDAEQSLRRFGEIAGRWDSEGIHGMLTFLLRREQGRLGGVAPALRAMAQSGSATLWGPGLVALYAELRMLDEARAEFERLAADGFAAIPQEAGKEVALGFAAEACVALGDGARASELFALLTPCQGKLLAPMQQACLGPADRLLALLAATAGRNDEAEELFVRAIDFSRRMPSPLWLAHCLHDASALIGRRDPEQAEIMLAEAMVLCERHGLAGLAQKLAGSRR
jgi:class 3 adenylate cyclase